MDEKQYAGIRQVLMKKGSSKSKQTLKAIAMIAVGNDAR